MAAVVTWAWNAEAFLHVDRAGRTSWRFLSSLEASGVPAKAAAFLRSTTVAVKETLAKSELLLSRGILSEYEELTDACASLRKQRATIASKFESTAPPHHRLRSEWIEKSARRPASDEEAHEALAHRVAADLRQSDHAIVDGFFTEVEARDDVGRLLRSMHARGELQPGRVKGGLSEAQRSDLMKHMPGAAEQPPALRRLLLALDRLLLALRRQEGMADLKAVPLVRAEVQLTCYPGDSSRYVRHTDDARQQTRKLTCIMYANPEWAAGDGGELRLHLGGAGGRGQASGAGAGAGADVAAGGQMHMETVARVETLAPLENRLVVFWSDARVPHEVLPTHKPRYAVSVWYSDARGVRAAAAATSAAAAGATAASTAAAASTTAASTAQASSASCVAPLRAHDGDSGRLRPFEVRRLPGRGLGVVAARPLAPGERVLAERPLVAWRVATRDGVADMGVFDRLVNGLSAAERADFYDLVDVHGPHLAFTEAGKIKPRPEDKDEGSVDESGDGFARKTSLGIYASNSFQLERGDCFTPAADEEDGIVHAAVFKTISRLNHSCCPNCFVAWNPALGQQTVHALRAIGAHEELTIAYLGGAAWDSRRDRRREELWRKYKFRCTCDQCSLSGAAFKASEERRRRILEVRRRLLDPELDCMPTEALVETLWELAEAEELPAVWQRASVIAAMRAAKDAGDADAAIRWAERGARSALLALGADAPTTAKFEMVVKAWTTAKIKGESLPG